MDLLTTRICWGAGGASAYAPADIDTRGYVELELFPMKRPVEMIQREVGNCMLKATKPNFFGPTNFLGLMR